MHHNDTMWWVIRGQVTWWIYSWWIYNSHTRWCWTSENKYIFISTVKVQTPGIEIHIMVHAPMHNVVSCGLWQLYAALLFPLFFRNTRNKCSNCNFTKTWRPLKMLFNWRRIIREPLEEVVLFKCFYGKVTGSFSHKINDLLKNSFDSLWHKNLLN